MCSLRCSIECAFLRLHSEIWIPLSRFGLQEYKMHSNVQKASHFNNICILSEWVLLVSLLRKWIGRTYKRVFAIYNFPSLLVWTSASHMPFIYPLTVIQLFVLQPIYPVHHIYKHIITWLYFNIYITWNISIKKKLILNNDCATTSLGWYVTSSSTATALITQCRHQTCPYSLASVTDNWYWWKLHGIWDHLGDKPVDTHGRDYLS